MTKTRKIQIVAVVVALLCVGGFIGTHMIVGNLNNIRFADQYLGGDCGAKINAADADLGAASGEIWVNQSCANGTGQLTIVNPVTISKAHSLKFVQGSASAGSTVWLMSAPITLLDDASIIGIPSGLNEDALNYNDPAVVLKEANSVNMPAMIILKGSNIELRDIALNGNNPTNSTTVGFTTDTSCTTSGCRGRIHINGLTTEQFGGDNGQIKSTLTNNQAIAFRVDRSSFNRSLNGNGLMVDHTTDVHITASQFELNSGNGVASNDSVVWVLDSDLSNNDGAQLLATVDTDTAIAAYLAGGLTLVGNGFTSPGAISSPTENAQSLVVIRGYNGTTCNVLGNTYIAFNTFDAQLGLPGNDIDGLRITDSGSNMVVANKFISGASTNLFKYGLSIGTVGAGCTEFADNVHSNGFFNNFGTGSGAPSSYQTSTDAECNMVGVSPGCQKATFGAQCVTGSSAGSTCGTATTNTWPVAFADTNYTVTCVQNGAPTANIPILGWIVTKTAANFTLQWIAGTAAAAQASGVDCVGRSQD